MQTQDASYGNFSEPTARAKRALMWSRVFLYTGGAIPLVFGIIGLVAAIASPRQPGSSDGRSVALAAVLLVALIPICAYYSWGTYWGWITIWRRFVGIDRVLPLIALSVLTAGLPLLIIFSLAGWYGILGGGIYQYRKAKNEVTTNADAANALSRAQRATEVNPNDVQAWQTLAIAYWTLRRFDPALYAIEKAIGLDRRSAALLTLKGGILRNAFTFSRNPSQLDGALAAFDQALAIDPSSSDARQARKETLDVRHKVGR